MTLKECWKGLLSVIDAVLDHLTIGPAEGADIGRGKRGLAVIPLAPAARFGEAPRATHGDR